LRVELKESDADKQVQIDKLKLELHTQANQQQTQITDLTNQVAVFMGSHVKVQKLARGNLFSAALKPLLDGKPPASAATTGTTCVSC
jgi:hypothetical protein